MFSLFKRQYQSKTYTYFIPAPTQMIKGYREKQADRLTNAILEQGFQLKSITTESISTESLRGMWIILHLVPLNKSAAQLDLNQFVDEIEDEISSKQNKAPIDGFYQLG